MRINLLDLNPDLAVDITGNEPWLARIYADFPVPVTQDGAPAPLLTGHLKVALEAGGSVKVVGSIQYAPLVPCSRCDIRIPWPMNITVKARFVPDGINPQSREKNLTRAELDAYYLEGDEADLEQLVNDLVQTALPTQVIAATDDEANCRICGDDLLAAVVYGHAERPAEASPFAQLATLKDPKLPH